MRLVVGDRDVVLTTGETAEFDTRVPHSFGSTGDEPAEVLSMFGPQGEQVRGRARSAEARGTHSPAGNAPPTATAQSHLNLTFGLDVGGYGPFGISVGWMI